jgi:hypothetical protein
VNARLYSFAPQPYYTVRQTPTGWAVGHALPGQPDSFGADVECPNQRAAEVECAFLNKQRAEEQQRAHFERQLLVRGAA